MRSLNQPGAPVGIVQCKHWRGKKVGMDKMRELQGVMAAFQVKRGPYAASSSLTAGCRLRATDLCELRNQDGESDTPQRREKVLGLRELPEMQN